MGEDANEVRREIEATRARMGDTVDALTYKADVPARVKDAVHDRVETVKGNIGSLVDNVADGVADATQRVTSVLTDAQRAAAYKVADAAALAQHPPEVKNPLGLALGALAVGVLAGLLTPVTNYERETVGPLRDELLDRAQSAGSEALEHGKHLLADAVRGA